MSLTTTSEFYAHFLAISYHFFPIDIYYFNKYINKR